MKDFEERFWSSGDGLKLHFRDYRGSQAESAADAPLPLLCLHGLTRNARDFELVASHLAKHRRVLCPDLRGRGESEYARDSSTYNPQQYCADILALLEQEGIDRFVTIGTSLGGLMVMGLATLIPDRIAGAVINDVGPNLDSAGLARIREYVGQGRSFPTWVHAARSLEDAQGVAHPGHPLDFWISQAKRLMAVSGNGRISFDYDMKIAEPLMALEAADQPDLWTTWDALKHVPVMILRGALSDLLSKETLAQMLRRNTHSEAVTLPNVGHAPTLDEPEAIAAIERLLRRAG